MGNIGERLKKLEQVAASDAEKPVYLLVVEDDHEPTEEQKQTAIAKAEEAARQSPKGLHYPLAVWLGTAYRVPYGLGGSRCPA